MLVAEYRLYRPHKPDDQCTWGISDYKNKMFYPFSHESSARDVLTWINAGRDSLSDYGGHPFKDYVPDILDISSANTTKINVNIEHITVNIMKNGRKFKDFDKT